MLYTHTVPIILILTPSRVTLIIYDKRFSRNSHICCNDITFSNIFKFAISFMTSSRKKRKKRDWSIVLFWRYLTRGIIWHLSESSIRPSICFSLIVKSRSNPRPPHYESDVQPTAPHRPQPIETLYFFKSLMLQCLQICTAKTDTHTHWNALQLRLISFLSSRNSLFLNILCNQMWLVFAKWYTLINWQIRNLA